MNLLQIIRKARFEIDAIRASGSTSALWSDEEAIDAANDAMDAAAKILRLADSDILSKTITSTDASINFVTEEYNPTSLALVSGTSDYTLPPDLVSIVSIRPTDDDFESLRFHPTKHYHSEYVNERTVDSTEVTTVQGDEASFLYTQIGARTLRLAPTPADSINIEIVYRYRPDRLLNYVGGQVQVVNESTAVHGVGTLWLTTGIRTPAELVVGSTSVVSLNTRYQRISSISGDCDLVLSRNYAGITQETSSYTIAMVPTLPEEHHQWLAKMTAAIMLRKVNIETSDKSRAALEEQLMTQVQPELVARQVQESITTEPFMVQ